MLSRCEGALPRALKKKGSSLNETKTRTQTRTQVSNVNEYKMNQKRKKDGKIWMTKRGKVSQW